MMLFLTACLVSLLSFTGRDVLGMDYFNNPGVQIKSLVLDEGYRKGTAVEDPETKLDLDNPWYIEKKENPQFGYSVGLVSFVTASGTGENILMGSAVVVSAPGKPSIEFTDPGFVELQDLKEQPVSLADKKDNDNVAQVIMPIPVKNYYAHIMFGSSLTLSNAVNPTGMGTQTTELHIGAPEGTNCDDVTPIGDDSISVDNFGRVFFQELFYSMRGDEAGVKAEPGQTAEIENACYGGPAFRVGDQKGFAQANRNQLGFSGHMSKDGLYLLFGAPMFHQQEGYVYIMYRGERAEGQFVNYQDSGADFKLYYMCPEKLKGYQGYDSSYGERATFASIICDIDKTYGYSVSSLKINDKTYLVAGGPRAAGIFGEIKIFHFTQGEDYIKDTFQFMKPVVGSAFNSGFGTTVCGVDLDGDGIDELIVGEPYHSDITTDTYNSGIVSIYKYTGSDYSIVYQLKSPNPSYSTMFGFKVSSLGDSDDDGGEDLVVTALNETNSNKVGKVYIISGRSLSSIYSSMSQSAEYPEILQEFTAESSQLFGFSIGDSKVDVDLNGYNDLVIGDPGKDAQTAYVHYSKTIIRLVYADSMEARLIQDKPTRDADCPAAKEFNFCRKIKIKLENRGIARIDYLYPDNPAVLKPWEFDNDFDVEVTLEKTADDSKLQILDYTQTVTMGSSDKEGTAEFFIYGEVPEIYGDNIIVNVLTNLKSGSTIELAQAYKGETVLAPMTFKEVSVAISSLTDVKMSVAPASVAVVLGDSDSAKIGITVTIDTTSGQQENFVGGELQINLGTTDITFTNAQSAPDNIATCQLVGTFVNCKFVDGKKFSKSTIDLQLEAKTLADGETIDPTFKLTYELHWANRKEDDRYEFVENEIHVEYYAELSIQGSDGSVAEKTAFSDGKSLDYSVMVENVGSSKAKAVHVDIFVPYDDAQFTIATPEGCDSVNSKGASKCSSEKCKKFSCTYPILGGKESKLISFTAVFKDEAFWNNLVNKRAEFFSTVEWETREEADYITILQNMIPENDKGSLKLGTQVTSEKAEFPWWIVVVTLIVSIAIVSIIIVVLYRRGFFTKRDPNKIRQDEIEDDEYVDDDEGMKVKKNNDVEMSNV